MRKGNDFVYIGEGDILKTDGKYDIPENSEEIKNMLLALIGKTKHHLDQTLDADSYCKYSECLQNQIAALTSLIHSTKG